MDLPSLKELDVHVLTPRLTAAVAGLAIAASTLSAQQESTRPSFGLSAGAAFPTGSFGDTFKSGYEVGAHLGFRPATSPVGFRLQGTYDRFDYDGSNVGDLHTNLLTFTGNVVAPVGGTEAVRPYLIGGVGIYNMKLVGDVATSESTTKLGLNGGAGLDFPLSGIAVFVEARYHYVFSDSDLFRYNVGFVPLSVGVRF